MVLLRRAVRKGSVKHATGANIERPSFRSAGITGSGPIRPRLPARAGHGN